jgi:8-oxo-dGTP diphosphatase
MAGPSRPLLQVAIAVIERNGRYLLGRRPAGSHLAGCWEFPGGKRRPGERWADCLARELREELGITARVGARLQSIHFDYPDCRVHLEAFRCTIEGTPKAASASALKWMTPAQLTRAECPPANHTLIELLAARRVRTSLAKRPAARIGR